jgi:hypothetical protein
MFLVCAPVAADTKGTEAAQKNPKEVTARIVDVDAPTKTLVVMVRGGGREEFTVVEGARVVDAAGHTLEKVLDDKRLKPGTEVRLTVGPDGKTCREVHLAPKLFRENRVQELRRLERERRQALERTHLPAPAGLPPAQR